MELVGLAAHGSGVREMSVQVASANQPDLTLTPAMRLEDHR